MIEHAISTKNLSVAYSDKPVIWKLDIDVEKGSRTAIVGPNGAGKSTLIKAIMKLVKPVSGESAVSGSTHKSALKEVAYVPQKGEVNWDFPATVFDVVLMGRYVHKGLFKRPNKQDKEIALQALKTMKMTQFKERQISELSGGQRQRVFLARAIAHDANIYIMDEPLQGIDITTEKLIIDTMKKLQADGKTFLVVHHNLNTVPDYFNRVIILNKEIIAAGPVEDVWTEDNINAAYYEKSDEPWTS
ncbi:putative ABC transporter ATP-binding protein [Jeotgalicoccus saudimassiliensis]|jgi:manganese/zinc/iron transport system ATP- binding protein|uniref:Putative ABC transporter ATP-binding protein n=1 Tax=Jeotgalicoccus saudimassiliensis TaxID=1461582 RepID=A0A078M4Y1_9STAP|nr:metal ABC transporter ATP-binding protein [Jeotgalicoccus saudimassiliensis]CEA01259.1 putative ABC transporter ATP-binding protein [Jeotgalicoccus saudimassiliensis]